MRNAAGSNIKWKLLTQGWTNPGSQVTKRLNFVQQCLVFSGPKYATFSCHPVGDQNFEVATPFLENLWTPDLKNKVRA